MTPWEELFEIAKRLRSAAMTGDSAEIVDPLHALEEAAVPFARSFSGSWAGYHSRVYYQDFTPPPPGARFSQEWGLMDHYGSSHGSRGAWTEYDAEEVKGLIRDQAGDPGLETASVLANKAAETLDTAKSEIVSILQSELEDRGDAFLETLKTHLERLRPLTPLEVAEAQAPNGQMMTRDTIVVGQGTQVPPHVEVLAEVQSIRQSFAICTAAADIAMKAGSHLERKSRKRKSADRVGTNVFIGHGRSKVWRDLKDFVQDRLKLPWDEFNRVPVAGVTNIARLSEMLDAAAVAFIVMTAEDEMADGAMQARMNVIHEAGLFQGRIGFTRAIVLLEEGCEEFSNIEGLGQIRFPKGNIAAVFEEIRRVLEREELIE